MTTDNFCLYLQNRLIQTRQTGGQQYSDTFPFSIPWQNTFALMMQTPLAIDSNFIFLKSKDYKQRLREAWKSFIVQASGGLVRVEFDLNVYFSLAKKKERKKEKKITQRNFLIK